MELKSDKGTIIFDDSVNPVYHGGASHIFRSDGVLLKVFHLVDGKSMSVLSEDNFDLISKIKHDNFIDLIERYHRVPKSSDFVEAYTYHEIVGKTYEFVECDTEFCIDQLNKLLTLVDYFSELGIKISDVSAENTVVLENRIVLIDPDLYVYVGTSKNVTSFNRNQLLFLILSYFYSYTGTLVPGIIDDSVDKENPIAGIAKKLSPYKRPIDYVKNR